MEKDLDISGERTRYQGRFKLNMMDISTVLTAGNHHNLQAQE